MRPQTRTSWGFKVTLDLSDSFPNHTNNNLVFFEEFYGETVDNAWKDAVDCYKNIRQLEYVGYCAVDLH